MYHLGPCVELVVRQVVWQCAGAGSDALVTSREKCEARKTLWHLGINRKWSWRIYSSAAAAGLLDRLFYHLFFSFLASGFLSGQYGVSIRYLLFWKYVRSKFVWYFAFKNVNVFFFYARYYKMWGVRRYFCHVLDIVVESLSLEIIYFH